METMRPNTQPSANMSDGKSMVKDDQYAVISAIYHCLQGQSTCAEYEQDAQKVGREDLARCFQDMRQQYLQMAMNCRKFLGEWVSGEEHAPSQSFNLNQEQEDMGSGQTVSQMDLGNRSHPSHDSEIRN